MANIVATPNRTFYRKGNFAIMGCSCFDTANIPTKLIGKRQRHGWFISIMGNDLPNQKASFEGSWEENPKGLVFKVSSYEVIKPDSLSGIATFFVDNFDGIGRIVARRIVKRFGTDAYRAIEEKDEGLYSIKGLTAEKIDYLSYQYRALESKAILSRFLTPYEISKGTIDKINNQLGVNAVDVIKANPFKLMELQGVGFTTCDKIANGLGIALDCQERIIGAVFQSLKSIEGVGNLYASVSELIVSSLKLLNKDKNVVTTSQVASALEQMSKRRAIVIRKEGDTQVCFLQKNDEDEYEIVQNLLALNNKKSTSVSINEVDDKLSQSQKEAVIKSLVNGVSIITGGPGTGKTTIIKSLLHLYRKHYRGSITLLAPTGKAARRMSEATGMDAHTIHSVLGLYEGITEPSANLPTGLIVVDESSMIDNHLMALLTKAITHGSTLVLVGDIDQLPSVGAGNVLGECINSQVIPTSRLTEIYRQAEGGVIVENAQKINGGELHLTTNDNFMYLSANNESVALHKLLLVYKSELEKYGIDNVAVLCPLRKSQDRFKVCADELNKVLQDTVNPVDVNKQSIELYGTEFRENDRIMQFKNTKTSSNGDVGYIAKIRNSDENGLEVLVSWENGNNVILARKDFETIGLAYCMSIHKSQGSEYKSVIIPLLSSQSCFLFKRNLLYTAVTRAKEQVCIIGDANAIKTCIEHTDTNKRKTLLGKRLIYNANKTED